MMSETNEDPVPGTSSKMRLRDNQSLVPGPVLKVKSETNQDPDPGSVSTQCERGSGELCKKGKVKSCRVWVGVSTVW